MKRSIILIVVLVLCNIAQSQSLFDSYNTSRFARPIAMGNSYVGVAEGVETTFYNSAGISFIDYYGVAYSYGNGVQPIIETNPFDLAITFPKLVKIGRFALSAHFLNMDKLKATSSTYRLHFSRLISKKISFGISMNYFTQNQNSSIKSNDFSSTTVDFSISGLFINENFLFENDTDVLKFGFQFNNLFASKIREAVLVIQNQQNNFLIQYAAIGFSYSYSPLFPKYKGLMPISVLFASDLIFDNSLTFEKYSFDRMNINYGFEFKILEMLAIRFGRENDKNLSYENYSTPQFPVTRFGIGLEIPIHKFIESKKDIFILFDYAFSEWQKQNKIDLLNQWQNQLYGKSDKYAFSIQFRADL